MSRKDFLKNILMSFFIVVTLVNVAMAVLGLLFDSNKTFGYEAFVSPLIFGVLGVVPAIVTYSKKELTMTQMVIRKVIQLILLESLLIGFVVSNGVVRGKTMISFAISVLLIAVAVHLILWILDNRKAHKLSLDLEKYQKKYAKGCYW